MSKVKINDYESEIEYYFNSLKHYKKRTRAEEKDLGERIQKGDNNA